MIRNLIRYGVLYLCLSSMIACARRPSAGTVFPSHSLLNHPLLTNLNVAPRDESSLLGRIDFLPPTMGTRLKRDIRGRVPRSDGRRYEAALRISEALSACREPEE